MSSLSVLYERPISQAVVAEWRRNRELYEREAKKRAIAPLVAELKREFRRPVPPRPKLVAAARTKTCLCGCGKPVSKLRGFRTGHKNFGAKHLWRDSWPRISEQVSRIPNTELGRLAKKVLLRELGRD